MNYPMEKSLAVAGDLNSIKIDRDLTYLQEDWNYTTRIDYSILESNHRLQELDVKNKIFCIRFFFENKIKKKWKTILNIEKRVKTA